MRVHSVNTSSTSFSICVLAGLLALHGPATAATLPLEAQQRATTATFEVVMEKPQHDSLTYERPLPLDLLPYTERTDKFQSIGTAFSIGDHRYVSAAHVLGYGFQTQFGEPALRDPDGKIFRLDKVLKYASNQDFIVFTVKDDPATGAWPVNREPVVNEPIFAVGNALGEGIVVRDGLFTSQTPEQLDGQWKWIRFSAAASPGNSGGPLLDQQGRVIGVVLRKSANENLNYAVPISLVLDAPDERARIEGQYTYWLPNMDIKESVKVHEDFAVPDSFAELAKNVIARGRSHYDELQHNLLTKHAAEIFPQGEGSQQLLHTVNSTAFPYLISRNPDGTWDAFYPQQTLDANLPHNGSVSIGALPGLSLARIRKPDDVTAASLNKDSSLFMDYLLKASEMKRRVGSDEVRVTSLGPAQQEMSHMDAYGRQWQVRTWNIEYLDMVIVCLSLPVPDGYVAILRAGTTAAQHDALLDLRAMTNFTYVSFTGTLAQWDEYMKLTKPLPIALADIHLDYDYGKKFRYQSKRIELSFDHTLQKIEKDTNLTLQFSYFDDAGHVVWDVAGVSVSRKDDGSGFTISRHSRPTPALPDTFRTAWDKMIAREYPYNATLVDAGGSASIDAIYPQPPPPNPVDQSALNVLYGVSYWTEGKRTQEQMDVTLAQWLEGVKVTDI